MTKKLLVLVSLAAVVALLVAGLGGFGAQQTPRVYASRLAGVSGAGETGIQVQNLDAAQAAQISADFYPQSGQAPTQFTAQAQAGGAANFYLPSLALQDGAYAAIVNSDRQIAAIARTDWPSKGGAAIYSNVIPATDVALALVTKEYGNQCSLISIQNTDTSSQAVATVEFYATGSATPAFTRDYPIQRGTSVTLRPCDDVDLVAQLPNNFLGSLRVKSKNGTTKFGVQSFVDISTSDMAVYAFEGVPADQAASELYAPLFRASQALGTQRYGNTGISVVNAGAADIDVTVTFYPSSLAQGCTGTYTHVGTVKASSSTVFWQGRGGGHGIPDGCFGSAKITAGGGGKILAIVNDAVDSYETGKFGIQSAAYNAVSSADAGTRAALPLFRTGHTNSLLWTGISAMNVGSGTADIQLSVQNSGGQTTQNAMSMSVGQYETAIFWPAPIRNAGGPWQDVRSAYGSATINSNQPVVVIVNDSSQAREANLLKDAATYVGIKVGQ